MGKDPPSGLLYYRPRLANTFPLPFIKLVVVELDYEFVEILHEVTESSRPLLASEQRSGARIPALQNSART
jgi:hypothetical protein